MTSLGAIINNKCGQDKSSGSTADWWRATERQLTCGLCKFRVTPMALQLSRRAWERRRIKLCLAKRNTRRRGPGKGGWGGRERLPPVHSPVLLSHFSDGGLGRGIHQNSAAVTCQVCAAETRYLSSGSDRRRRWRILKYIPAVPSSSPPARTARDALQAV